MEGDGREEDVKIVHAGFELTLSGGDDEEGNIGLRGTSDHVLDEVTVAWGVDDGELELRKK